MEQTNHTQDENINEVITNGINNEFSIFVQQNDGSLKTTIIPNFMVASYVNQFGQETPNQIQFDIWYKGCQASMSETKKDELL